MVLCCSSCSAQETQMFFCMAWVDGKLSLFAVQHKTVMETTRVRVCYYQFGVANLVFLLIWFILSKYDLDLF